MPAAGRYVAVVALLLATAAFAVWQVPRIYDEELSEPFEPEPSAWATSQTCASCHPDHHASWYRTFHRTMTQEATPAAVRGEFDGVDRTWWGVAVRPVERDGRYAFEYRDPATGRLLQTLPVERTVGSRRYQQYLTRTPDGGETYYRVHLLWHIEEERWMHINGAFLGPDEQGFDDHVAVWNHNCIFCHNTGPEPNIVNLEEMNARARRGERVDSAREARYDSQVAELGIACESCHGPAAEHATRNRDPLRRYALYLGDRDDPTVVHPAKLDRDRGVEICGQCHGQRTPESAAHLARWIDDGPTYRAGADLDAHVNPVWRETRPPGGAPVDLFALRFWADGTPRLTAYEYQGLLLSPCYQRGELSCLSCHTMHAGDVYGQLPPENRTDLACASCHEGLVADPERHSGHPATAASCFDCHMPRMVYGIMEIHRSHRIESPDPRRDAEAGRPDACTSCHLDRSPRWAAEAMAARWPGIGTPTTRRDGADPAVVDSVASLHAGDPVQRAVAARLAGRGDAVPALAERAFLVPHLLVAMDDGYPAVRRFAWHSLRAIAGELAGGGELDRALAPFDFIAPAAERRRGVDAAWQAWSRLSRSGWSEPPPGALVAARYDLDRSATAALVALGRQRSKRIDIGE